MFKNITLEISLKPFRETREEYIRSVCREMFEQWRPLAKGHEVVSVMMWSADGSELLDYSGSLDDEFEWCKYVGGANNPPLGDFPRDTSPHMRKQLYIENPPAMTYGILQNIVRIFREEGQRMFPKSKIRVGTTFDIGPEFAVSDFKYNRHKEICKGYGCDSLGFVDATAYLNGDNHKYAAYPNGIPDQTPMGSFLGKQANAFMRDIGFNYIWLSNGMGFCFETWRNTGVIYDGERFYTEKLAETKAKIFRFWELFRAECPDFPIETRGTNFSVGIDYASDGVPLYDIYRGGFNITPPPNSPWGALNDDFGIEVLGQLTRNCELPGKDYMFRFYLHDIWWMNSPWYDRYGCEPYDIYIPMALSRIDENGQVQPPTLFNVLSVDNSMGEMPDNCANEVIPHILRAEADAPDEPSPIVLVYPFREYTSAGTEGELREMYLCDTFLQNAINRGFPVATAVSADNFAKHREEIYKKSVLVVSAAMCGSDAVQKLKEFALSNGRIIAYGSQSALANITFPCEKVDVCGDCNALFDALKVCGYSVAFDTSEPKSLPVMTIHRSDNAMIFSGYSRNTTVKTSLSFPLGAPILKGFDAEVCGDIATYCFDKCVHSECRVFVKQESGTVKVAEESPVNMKYRRRIRISGLENAEVCLFGEEYCKADCVVTDCVADITPVICDGWIVKNTPEHGTYLYKKGVSGTVSLCMPR